MDIFLQVLKGFYAKISISYDLYDSYFLSDYQNH